MINFVQEKYGVSVSCPQVNQDGYEVTNLIINKKFKPNFFSLKNTGFLVEYFIKPPVEIIFRFPLPVEVSAIHLGLSVGAQTTDGIELLVSDEHNDKAILQSVFYQCPIGKTYLAVSNGRFRPRAPFIPVELQRGHPKDDTLNSIFKASRHLFNVKTLKVRIIKTSGSSVPALGSVKVFGQLARSCKEQDCRRIVQLCANEQDDDSSDSDVQILPTPPEFVVPKKGNDFQVPDEFLDPLTCEVMVLPVLLPSGQSVDRSTLEKTNQNQASWGHVPCDPFTGIPFGPGRQPVSNAPLKARMDAFLIKNAHLDPALASRPRTIGNPESKQISDLHKPPAMINRSSSSIAAKPVKFPTTIHQEFLHTIPSVSGFSSQGNKSLAKPSAHEIVLEDSLRLALQACLNESSVGPVRSSSYKKSVCVGCCLEQSSTLYKVPCGHLHCRTCLFRQNTCLMCKKEFSKGQVQRVYNLPS